MKNIIDSYNALVGMLVTVASAIFGEHWILFAGFLLFNVLDWLTGWAKSRKLGKESSIVGARGAMKKVWYWVLVTIAFLAPCMLMEAGPVLGLDLSFLQLLGWFVLASLTVNELRSIVENLVELGVNVPDVFIRGLAIAQKLIEKDDGKNVGA